MKPRFDMNRNLNRIAVGILLIFVLVILLLPLAVTRYLQLQAVDAEVDPEIQEDIQDLQDTTEELQETVDQIQAQADDREVSASLEVIDQTLEEMSEQIEQIGDDLAAMPTAEATSESLVVEAPTSSPDETIIMQDELLTLIGWTVGLLSIVTAALCASIILLRGKRRRRPIPTSKDVW